MNKFYIKLKDNYYIKLIISYSIFLVLILFIGFYLYNMSKTKLVENIQNQSIYSLSSCVSQFSDSFVSMRNLSISISKNTEVRTLSRMDADDSNEFYQAGYNALESISNYSVTQQLLPITSYFIYFNHNDYVLSSNSFTTTWFLYKSLSLSSNCYGRFKDTITNENGYHRLIPMSQFKEISDDYLYIIPINTFLYYNVPAQLCFIVDSEKLTKPLLPLLAQSNSSLYIISEDDSLLFSLGDTSNTVTTDLLSNLRFNDTNIASTKIDKRNVSIMKLTDTTTNYTFYYVLPNTFIHSLLSQYQNMFLLVILSGTLIGILLLFVVSKHNVRPYTTMNTQLKDSLSLTEQLQHRLDALQPIIYVSYIRNLLLGKVSSKEELLHIEECLTLTDKTKIYSCLYIVTYPQDTSLHEVVTNKVTEPATIGNEMRWYDTYIVPLIKKHFGEHLHMYSPKKYHYAIIISHEDVTNTEEAFCSIKSIFSNFNSELLESYSILSIAGVGNYNHYAENLWKSYQQALESISYASGTNSICWYGALRVSSDSYYFPAQISESLTNFITTGNTYQVTETFKFIIKENMELRTLSYPKLQHLLMELYHIISRIRYSIPDSDVTCELEYIDKQLKEHLSFRQLEDIANKLCEFFAQYTSQKQTIIQIKQFIKEHYKDASLCLSMLSDEFHLSESYLSYLFKESTGENFSMYLETIRMEAAMKLVKETSTPLSDIYLEVGYNNANSFRRVFKKTYGVSAKTIRDTQKVS